MILTITSLIAGLVLLIICGSPMVRGVSGAALKFNVRPLVIGLTIVAFGSTAPELVTSMTSTLKGNSEIVFGNIVGSTICNLTLFIGLSVLIRPIVDNKNSLRIGWPVTLGISLLLYLIIRAGIIYSHEELVFVIIMHPCLAFIAYYSRKVKTATRVQPINAVNNVKSNTLFKSVALIVIGGTGLLFGGELFVNAARDFSRFPGVVERKIGLTVVATSTSLSELVASFIAIFKKLTNMTIGNLMGSNIFNFPGIFGITSLIKDVNVKDVIVHANRLWMLVVALIVFPKMVKERKFAGTEGMILMII